ncbi:jg22815 [Pararge aegeria aegeria]|uniref:Jg22815 protein n=1 Tax=Pararge aegeria aegeria TaxID=348720 RepID=A0A8S4S2A9_9NEOP|nr:jg22815 [Pararge aegeria aegeria]
MKRRRQSHSRENDVSFYASCQIWWSISGGGSTHASDYDNVESVAAIAPSWELCRCLGAGGSWHISATSARSPRDYRATRAPCERLFYIFTETQLM